MSKQTQAIRLKMSELAGQIGEMQSERNECVLALATNPNDKSAAEKLSKLQIAIPKVEYERASFESALAHSTRRDHVDKKRADAERRRAQAAEVVRLCGITGSFDPQLESLRLQIHEVRQKRERARDACQSAMRNVITQKDFPGGIYGYADQISILSNWVVAGYAPGLQRDLERILDQIEMQEGVSG